MNTRGRLKFKSKHFVKTSDKVLLVAFIILIFSIFWIISLSRKSMPVLMDYARSETTKISTILINQTVNKYLSNFEKIDEIFITSLNKNDEIISVDFNTKVINESLYEINNSLLEQIYYLENGDTDSINVSYFNNDDYIYYIPFGMISGVPFLNNLGPKIPLKVNIIGSVASYVSSSVTNYGINNSLLELFINVEVKIQIILPFMSDKLVVENKIPIGVKVIQGKIPTYYGGLIQNNSPVQGGS